MKNVGTISSLPRVFEEVVTVPDYSFIHYEQNRFLQNNLQPAAKSAAIHILPNEITIIFVSVKKFRSL